jgi:hypothetical protein
MSQSDDQGRSQSNPYGQGSSSSGQGQPPQYGEQQQYGEPQQYGQQPDPAQQYGQPAPYGQAAYGQPQYGQQPYAQAQPYGQQYDPAQQYGQQAGYGQYGTSAVPAKPAAVTIAAIFGFIYGALGVLVTLGLIFVAAVSGGAASDLENAIPGFGSFAGALAGIVIVFGLLALAWTILMILGSVRALSGRSRVPLIVGGSIAIFATGLSFFGSLGDNQTTAGGMILSLIFFLVSIAIVVLLCLKPAADFFAAHRARRVR